MESKEIGIKVSFWYCLEYDRDKIPYDTPSMQVRSLESLNDDEKGEVIPAIPDKCFNSFKVNHLKEYSNAKKWLYIYIYSKGIR